jgi:hypothetical protein
MRANREVADRTAKGQAVPVAACDARHALDGLLILSTAGYLYDRSRREP